MLSSGNLLDQCKKGDAQAQRILYDIFKGKLMGLCRRYTSTSDEAKDILQETFIRIFSKLNQLEAPEKLESWMKSIAVRTAINHYWQVRSRSLIFSKADYEKQDVAGLETTLANLSDEHLITIINELPDGCRMIFNLFAIEGYSHTEIAQMLDVSEGTSRSQYHHAKFLIKEKLKCHNLSHYYEKFA